MIQILFENEEIIVVDKPSGLAAQPGEGVRDDVVQVLERQLGFRPFPVNRLDKETAGCMILAKNSKAAGTWSGFVAERSVVKRYYAWVSGAPLQGRGVIDTLLDGARGAQKARTLWNLKEVWRFSIPDGEKGGCAESPIAEKNTLTVSLLELELETGRMHQIRRHLADVSLPILGDDRHGDFPLNRVLRRAGVRRLMLWSRELILPARLLPPGGASIVATEPPHFAAFREFLGRAGSPVSATESR